METLFPDKVVIIWYICFGLSMVRELSRLWFIQQWIMKQRWLSENCEHRLFWGIATLLGSIQVWLICQDHAKPFTGQGKLTKDLFFSFQCCGTVFLNLGNFEACGWLGNSGR